MMKQIRTDHSKLRIHSDQRARNIRCDQAARRILSDRVTLRIRSDQSAERICLDKGRLVEMTTQQLMNRIELAYVLLIQVNNEVLLGLELEGQLVGGDLAD